MQSLLSVCIRNEYRNLNEWTYRWKELEITNAKGGVRLTHEAHFCLSYSSFVVFLDLGLEIKFVFYLACRFSNKASVGMII
jgi:hypothetical protein